MCLSATVVQLQGSTSSPSPLCGDIDKLRALVRKKFEDSKSTVNPIKRRFSSKQPDTLKLFGKVGKFAKRCKAKRAPSVHAAAVTTADGWTSRTYQRKSGAMAGQAYTVYRDRSGKAYTSLKKAMSAGYCM